MTLTRRLALWSLLAAALLGACATPPAPTPIAYPPIVFVHGNGDAAAIWVPTMWRFESNGWPRERLHAIDVTYPVARDDDSKPQEGRTSTTEHMQFLAAEVERVRKATGADKVVLYGLSRGGNAIRNYIANAGGASTVSHAILGGTPNHGVWANKEFRPGNEFNGAGSFLMALNAPKGPNGDEVTPGPKWMTIRSDNNDLYAQPDGAFIGSKGQPTNVSFEGPALKGALNVVLPGIDHRETALHASAFEKAYEFITGKPPSTTAITPESNVVLDGKVTGLGFNHTQGVFANNLPHAGATLEVYRTDPKTGERIGGAAHRKAIGADGMWGPFKADGSATYEFVISAPGYATTHIYRSPFPRSSNVVGLRASRLADADKDAKSVVTLARPRGYFTLPRDRVSLDGAPPPSVQAGVGSVSSSKLKVTDTPGRTVSAEFNGERVVGRAWPTADNRVVWLELHH